VGNPWGGKTEGSEAREHSAKRGVDIDTHYAQREDKYVVPFRQAVASSNYERYRAIESALIHLTARIKDDSVDLEKRDELALELLRINLSTKLVLDQSTVQNNTFAPMGTNLSAQIRTMVSKIDKDNAIEVDSE